MDSVHKLKKPKEDQDKKMTPIGLGKKLIDLVPFNKTDFLLDGFKGTGEFYNNYPVENPKDWCEIDEGRDFFKYDKQVDYMITNCAYSTLTKTFKHCCKICKKGFGLLIGTINLSVLRYNILLDNNFSITKMHFLRVQGWFGTSVFVIIEKNKKSLISWENDIFKMPKNENDIYQKYLSDYNKNYYITKIKKS